MNNGKNRNPDGGLPIDPDQPGTGMDSKYPEEKSDMQFSKDDGTDDVFIDVPDDPDEGPGKTPKAPKSKRPWSTRKKVIVWGSIGLVAAIIIFAGVYVYSIWSNPMGQFDSVAQQASTAPASTESVDPASSETSTVQPTDSPSPSVSESVDPYDELVNKGDFSILQDYVNVMLIGVDYTTERKTWNGKHAYHADVMLVLSINKKTNEIHMISLPRDTYAKIPGVKGIYKLNASIDCGGGWPKPAGFEKVCEAASWMLGDKIPVKYYYAVDMQAVKGLVEAVGGVDYKVDLNFKLMGRSYKKGQQHMNGQAVLDYLRVRKNVGSASGDLNRINRQKKMLVAIFKKLQDTQLMFKIPDILKAFDGNLFTNTTFEQTAALAAFAYKVDPEKIYMHSMSGTYHNIFNWRFVITDQNKRVQLIKDVYGIKVPPRSDYDYSSAISLWANMQSKVVSSKSKSVLSKVKNKLEADDKLPVKPEPTPSESTPPAASISQEYRKYTEADRALYSKAKSQCDSLLSHSGASLNDANQSLIKNIEKLCSIFKISKPSWRVNYEKSSNQVYVDFR